jgi:hypothetical protein
VSEEWLSSEDAISTPRKTMDGVLDGVPLRHVRLLIGHRGHRVTGCLTDLSHILVEDGGSRWRSTSPRETIDRSPGSPGNSFLKVF